MATDVNTHPKAKITNTVVRVKANTPSVKIKAVAGGPILGPINQRLK